LKRWLPLGSESTERISSSGSTISESEHRNPGPVMRTEELEDEEVKYSRATRRISVMSVVKRCIDMAALARRASVESSAGNVEKISEMMLSAIQSRRRRTIAATDPVTAVTVFAVPAATAQTWRRTSTVEAKTSLSLVSTLFMA
jgi:hypothetical protein